MDDRYHGLDALRGTLMMLGIVLHGAFFYLSEPPPVLPIRGDGGGAYAFDLLFHFIHSFRIPAFFVLAGFFAALLVARRGLAATYRNRAARVGLPLLLAVLLILPGATLFMLDFVIAVRYGAHDLIPQRTHMVAFAADMRASGVQGGVSLGHLWFLYYLCWFYLLIPACAALVRLSHPLAGAIERVTASPAAILLLGAVTAAALWPFPGGQVLGGFIFLKPHLPSLVYYGSFFVVGFILYTYRGLLSVAARHPGAFAVAGLGLFALSTWLSRRGAPQALAVTVSALCTWALIYACIGGALRFVDRASPWVAYVSRSAYWVFLAHMPVATAAAWWLVRYNLPVPMKFALVVAITTTVCFTTYHYLVQRSWVSVLLNGKRFDMAWPWRPQNPSLAPTVNAS